MYIRFYASISSEILQPLLIRGFFTSLNTGEGYPFVAHWQIWMGLSLSSSCMEVFESILCALSHSIGETYDKLGCLLWFLYSAPSRYVWSAQALRGLIWPDTDKVEDRMIIFRVPFDPSRGDKGTERSLLSLIANIYGYTVTECDQGGSGWRTWVRDVVTLSNDLHLHDHLMPMRYSNFHTYGFARRSPLLWMLDGAAARWMTKWWVLRRWMQEIDNVLRTWVGDLQDCGVDIKAYGKQEAKLLLSNPVLLNERWLGDGYYSGKGPKLQTISYGSSPEDWSLVWDFDAEEYAGEFWDLVENALPKIPGAWVDDD